MVVNHDQSSTITIGNSDTGDSSATVNNLIGSSPNNNSYHHEPPKEQNQLFNGFSIVERNVVYIFEQLNFIIRTRFQTSTTLFAPSICFLLIFVYVLNLFTSPRASTVEPDKISAEFHKTESVISSTLTLVPGKLEIQTGISLVFACSSILSALTVHVSFVLTVHPQETFWRPTTGCGPASAS